MFNIGFADLHNMHNSFDYISLQCSRSRQYWKRPPLQKLLRLFRQSVKVRGCAGIFQGNRPLLPQARAPHRPHPDVLGHAEELLRWHLPQIQLLVVENRFVFCPK